jgi:hypothetical protein
MTERGWGIATLISGLAALVLFVAFAMLPEMRAAADCLAAGSVVQFGLARNVQDLAAIFGASDSACRPLAVAAMDAVNRLDLIAFIPAYTAFCISAALFLADGDWRRPLAVAAVLAALLAAAADYLETVSLLAITQNLDDAGALLSSSQLGGWSNFALLAAHALFCAGLCFVAGKRRPILGALLLLPAPGVAAAAYDHVALASVMNGGFAIAWIALLVVAAITTVRAKGASA